MSDAVNWRMRKPIRAAGVFWVHCMDRGAVEKGAVLQRLEKMSASRYFATVSPRALSSHSRGRTQGRTTFHPQRCCGPRAPSILRSQVQLTESPMRLSLIQAARTSCPPRATSHSIVDCEMVIRASGRDPARSPHALGYPAKLLTRAYILSSVD